ncbi:hypothetical protein TNCT_424301 [Trichonephila clavata]|uniref:Uncharacterized protein n=1 Tax=Trichonephila clavata TaxID=2740835 RepID=A0A8X6HPE5_TRICU|nr:hypothetical protein TNCT_424301 [Trichonephila clavata]
MVSSKAFQKILVWSEVHQFLEDARREKLVLLNGKTRNLFFFCQMHLVSNLKAAARGGRKNKDREQISDNLPLQGHIILTWEVLICWTDYSHITGYPHGPRNGQCVFLHIF